MLLTFAVLQGFLFLLFYNLFLQELFAFGTSHVLSSLLFCYPTTSSLSRTLVKDIAGGKSMVGTSLLVVSSLGVGWGEGCGGAREFGQRGEFGL